MVSSGSFMVPALLLGVATLPAGVHCYRKQVDQAPMSEAVSPSPIVWVPGITSTALKARIDPAKAADDKTSKMESVMKACYWARDKFLSDEEGYFPLYPSTSALCIQQALRLTGKGTDGDCVQDQDPLDIQPNGEVGLGHAVGTDHGFGIGLLDKLREKAFEKGAGYSKDDYQMFYYDWRKYGDPCWNRKWFAALKQLVEERVQQVESDGGSRKVTLGCHSMGCQLVHVFLNQDFATPKWKADHIEHFIATGPPFAGSAMVMQALIEGPVSRFSKLIPSRLGRSVTVAMPGFSELLPSKGMGDIAWRDAEGNAKELVKFFDGRSFTVESLYDGSFVAAVESLGLDVPLKEFTKNALTDNMALKPPGVPTTCMYIVDVDTPNHFTYTQPAHHFGSTKSVVDGFGEGDGTVNREAMEGPCKWFQHVQRQENTGAVALKPLKLNGDKSLWHPSTWKEKNHISMLFHTVEGGFLDQLAGVIRDGPPMQ